MAVTLEDAKLHIHVTDPARDPEVTLMLAHAQAQVEQYLGAQLASVRADLVDRGILVALAHNYEHRGDDAADGHAEGLATELSLLFMQSRDPAIA
jgi:hypothetical protein